MCVLRERGQPEEAERLRAGELMTMVASVRTPTDSDAAIAERLNVIFAAESERVANASVLCELLLPVLAEKFHLQVKLPAAPPVATALELPLATVPPEPIPEKPAAPRSASIADFIDEMIAQEKPPPRSGGNTQRRAS